MDSSTNGRTQDDRGATATEYGLLIGFIAFIVVAGVALFGNGLNGYFVSLASWLDGVI